VVGNIERVYTAARSQGKATIRLKSPRLDVFISDADPEVLLLFLATLFRVGVADVLR
tara:strand:+ start:121 stop:291 length:171 start_codon:yes stop_codon:yes gene_type:complete